MSMSLIVFIALVVVAAASGAVFKPGEWYERLEKPSWTPPNLAFPIVWTVLYVMIAAAGWLVFEAAGFNLAVILWGIQLCLNAAWSWLFFGRRRMDLAMGDVAALWVTVALFILVAWPVSMTASLLFLPYLVWVSIAAALNLKVMRLNPQAA